MEYQKLDGSVVVKSTPRDCFVYLLNVAALYFSVVGFITLFFKYIDWLFPDQLAFYLDGTLIAIRWSTAVLLVVFPVYLLTAWLINRDLAANPQRDKISVRRWLTYLTLFLAAVTLVVDLVTLIFNFLTFYVQRNIN